MSCERHWEIRAIDEGRLAAADVAAFERHERTCACCRDERAALSRVRNLVRQLPPAEPTPLELRRLRGRVLRDAMSAPRTARARVVRIAAALAVAAVMLVVGYSAQTHLSRPEPFAATVLPSATAAWTQVRTAGVERVTLRDGTVTLSVRKQTARERFLVIVPDGEIEVRGTTFEVSVADGKTARVHVDDGVVVVRVGGESVLVAGESWPRDTVRAPSSLAVLAPSPSVASTGGAADWSPPATFAAPERLASAAPAAVVPSVPSGPPLAAIRARGAPPVAVAAAKALPARPGVDIATTTAADDRELAAYEQAVAAYRGGRFEAAADLLHAFALEHPSSSLLDDASFLEASSLAGAGRGDSAALLAERHLSRFPASFHREDASILVARLHRDRGDCVGARRVLAPWANRAPIEPRVSAALGSCAPGR